MNTGHVTNLQPTHRVFNICVLASMMLSEQFFQMITIEDTLCIDAVVTHRVNLWTDARASILTSMLCIGIFVPVNVLFDVLNPDAAAM